MSSSGSCVGSGSFGAVYTTSDPKIVCKKYNDVGLKYNFLLDLACLRALESSGCVPKLVSYDLHSEHPSIQMERYQGDLRDIITESRLDEINIRHIMYQILLALKETHRLGIVHQDIKPDNILFKKTSDRKRYKIALADWGNARLMSRVNKNFGVIQTGAYRAPEVLLGLQNYTTKVDIWSLGCIMAQLYTRRYLFSYKHNEVEQLMHIFKLCGTPDSLAGTFPNFASSWENYPFRDETLDLLKSLLEADPRWRASAEEALAHPYFDPVRDEFPPGSADTSDRFSEISTDTDPGSDALTQTLADTYHQRTGLDSQACLALASRLNDFIPTMGDDDYDEIRNLISQIILALDGDLFCLDSIRLPEVNWDIGLRVPKLEKLRPVADTEIVEQPKRIKLEKGVLHSDGRYLYRVIEIPKHVHYQSRNRNLTPQQWMKLGVILESEWEKHGALKLYPRQVIFRRLPPVRIPWRDRLRI